MNKQDFEKAKELRDAITRGLSHLESLNTYRKQGYPIKCGNTTMFKDRTQTDMIYSLAISQTEATIKKLEKEFAEI